MSDIIHKPHKTLNKIAQVVDLKEIKTAEFKAIIDKMQANMKMQEDGVAIAAPQINISKQIFIIEPRHIHKNNKDLDTVYINPKIIKSSKEKIYMLEGCLSVRWLYGEVLRHTKCTLEYTDINGKKKVKGASGLLSQIFQHETDHLNGILFDSKAINLEDLPPEKLKERQNQGQSLGYDKKVNLDTYINKTKSK